MEAEAAEPETIAQKNDLSSWDKARYKSNKCIINVSNIQKKHLSSSDLTGTASRQVLGSSFIAICSRDITQPKPFI